MNTIIFIPKTIHVGFQKRSDCYTGLLAYIIYYDQKKKLRKEKSWNGWRDENIDSKTFENEPISGFVLNKKTGDYKSNWGNHRQAYTRIYDPRDFEFEITIENLLYILENTNSIKGKGLEGDFVYGWDKDKLILIPTSSPDYIEISKFNEMIHKPESIKGKDLVLGGQYKTNQNEEWIYLGRFDRYNTATWDKEKYRKNEGPHYFFWNGYYQTLKSLSGRIIQTISTEPVENYAELLENLEHKDFYSPVDDKKSEYIPYTIDEINEIAKRNYFCNPVIRNIYFKYNEEIFNCDILKKTGWSRDMESSKNLYYLQFYYNCNSDIENFLYRKYAYNENHTLQELHNELQFCKCVPYLVNGKILK